MRTNRKLLSFLNLQLHCLCSVQYCCTDGGRFLSNSARLCVFFFFIFVFALYWLIRVWFSFLLSFFINWYAFDFIWYFASVPLGRGYRESRISVFVCTCFFLHFRLFVSVWFPYITFLHFSLFVLKPLVFVGCFVTLPPSLRRLVPSLIFRSFGFVRSGKEKKLFTKVDVCSFRQIFVLIIITYIKLYIYIYTCKTKKNKRNGASAKTAMNEITKQGKV